MQIKVFHPYFKSSFFCKEWLKKFDSKCITIYENEDFNIEKDVEQIKDAKELIFLFPFWWYSTPWNFIKWIEEIQNYKNVFTNKKIKIVVMTGGHVGRYDPDSLTGVKNMNKWLDEFFNFPTWEIYYGCVPEKIDNLRKVWFKKWDFEKGKSHE